MPIRLPVWQAGYPTDLPRSTLGVVLREALFVQLTTPAAYLKLGAAAAILGAIAAGAISFTMPRRYVSTAVMRFAPQAVPDGTAWQIAFVAGHRMQEMQQKVLSRSSLAEMIQRPSLDLYRNERAIRP